MLEASKCSVGRYPEHSGRLASGDLRAPLPLQPAVLSAWMMGATAS